MKPQIWGGEKRYNDFASHFKRMFNKRVQKVSIDAGFTCPNRDGTKGRGGCTYCNNTSFKPSYCNLETSVSAQIERGIRFFSERYHSIAYLAYFQAYTNTYAPLENLISMYEEALAHPEVIGLVIATRPDCLPEEVLDYLMEISKQCYVMVELGLESCEDETLLRINRGHTWNESQVAVKQLAERGIHNCVHLIAGLPGENRELVLKQAAKISELPVENLKLHQLQIHKGTIMERQYRKNPEEFELYNNVGPYIELMADYLELLRPEIIVERFISQSPPELLVAPRWGLKNFEFTAMLEKRLLERDTWQGRLYVDPVKA